MRSSLRGSVVNAGTSYAGCPGFDPPSPAEVVRAGTSQAGGSGSNPASVSQVDSTVTSYAGVLGFDTPSVAQEVSAVTFPENCTVLFGGRFVFLEKENGEPFPDRTLVHRWKYIIR